MKPKEWRVFTPPDRDNPGRSRGGFCRRHSHRRAEELPVYGLGAWWKVSSDRLHADRDSQTEPRRPAGVAHRRAGPYLRSQDHSPRRVGSLAIRSLSVSASDPMRQAGLVGRFLAFWDPLRQTDGTGRFRRNLEERETRFGQPSIGHVGSAKRLRIAWTTTVSRGADRAPTTVTLSAARIWQPPRRRKAGEAGRLRLF